MDLDKKKLFAHVFFLGLDLQLPLRILVGAPAVPTGGRPRRWPSLWSVPTLAGLPRG